MKKLSIFLIALGFGACQQNKIGFVDNVKLMEGYQEKIDVENVYKKKAEALTKKSDSLSKAFQLEYQELQTRARRMSEKKMQEEVALFQQRSQFLGQQLRQEEQLISQEGQAKMDSVIQVVKSEIEAYGSANGYTYILGGGEGGSVLFGEKTNDLTQQVLTLLNEKYKTK